MINLKNVSLQQFEIIIKYIYKEIALLENFEISLFLTPKRPISSVILPPRMIKKTKLPHRLTELFLNIINEALVAEIASWIDKNADISNTLYEFKLLLHGSRDEFTMCYFGIHIISRKLWLSA
ncbi:hypothetical protein C2G38_2233931 [Gigaspora rosea]|uniref:Uncharacterized protein n=1 Tax=Gigaspora rosea TaxID=44941 RepID=A0A397TSY2_9GLOM|nr:hypothetical protein C2G38_2233931 [Gigaspora rosea]